MPRPSSLNPLLSSPIPRPSSLNPLPSSLIAALIIGGFTLVILGSAGEAYLYRTMEHGKEFDFWPSVRWPGIYWYSWALLTPLVFGLAKRYRLDADDLWRNLGMLVLGCAVVLALHVGLQLAAMALPVYHNAHSDFDDAVSFHIVSSIHTNLITVALLVGVWHAGSYYHRLRMRDIQHANLESQLRRAELQSLKMQIQPHFLFNTLNGIAELMHRDVDAAEGMLSHLSGLLRTSIDRPGDQFVRLDDELAFVRHNLEIEQVRFADRLVVRVDVKDSAREALVPSFVLQPFVENAIKHGVARHSGAACVRIGASVNGDRLRLDVMDDGPGVVAPAAPGIGIANVARRLDFLYGDDYDLRFGNGDAGFHVTMDLPLR